MKNHLVLFFTRGVSLRTWGMMGMLQREVAIYRRLIQEGFAVSFITYGDAGDLAYAEELGGIRILCNESGLPSESYEQELFSLHRSTLEDCTVIKTNQTYGADLALDAARRFGKPFVARCGYMWSSNAAREHGYDSEAAAMARAVEHKVFSAADRVFVTTRIMQMDVSDRIPEAASKTVVIPNYVDTNCFRPLDVETDQDSLLFVGRIAPEKNLDSLLEAVRLLDVKLTLIGEGKLRAQLQRQLPSLDGRVKWEGNVPNSELPQHMNRATAFVLPSRYEGHPKALIEAMACGVPVIGADSPGIREVITHMQNGYLCGTDPHSIRTAILELLSDHPLCKRLSANARTFVCENFALEKIAGLELAHLRKITER